MVKITTNTGKEYTISENTDLEVLANELHHECTANAEGYGTISTNHLRWAKTTITKGVFDEDSPAEMLWTLLNCSEHLYRESEGATDGYIADGFYEVFGGGFYRHYGCFPGQEWHYVDRYYLDPLSYIDD